MTPRVGSTLVFLMLIFVTAPASEGTVWSPLSNIDPGTTADDWLPQPAITPDGTAWVVWDSYDPVELDKEIFYSRWSGGSWEPRKTVNPPNSTADGVPRISCAYDGTLWVLWRALGSQGGAYMGLTSHWLGTEWSWPDTVWQDGDRYNNFDFTAVSATEAWFSREGQGGDILVYHLLGGARDTTRFDLPSASGYQPTIAVDAASVVWAAWTHQESYPTPERLEFSRRVAGVWTQPEILQLPVETKLPRLTVDRDDVKWIVCAGDDPNNTYKGDDIWALRWNGNTWDPPTRISEAIQSNDSLQVYNAVSRTPGQYPRAVWVRANLRNYTRRDVLTTAWDGSTWSPVELVGSLADSSYLEWPDVAVRGSSVWVAWMAEPEAPPYVLNIVSLHSIPITTDAFSAELLAIATPGGIRLSWSLDSPHEVERLGILRVSGSSALSEPPGDTQVILMVPPERFRAGSFLDRPIPRAGVYTYWLQITLRDGRATWVGPRSALFSPPPPRSSLVAASPNPSGDGIVLRGVRGIDQPISVNVYAVDGRLVRVLPVDTSAFASPAGDTFTLTWDGRGGNGLPQSNGIYFARLVAAGPRRNEASLKLVLLR